MVAQLAERPSKSSGSVQLSWGGFKSRPENKVVRKKLILAVASGEQEIKSSASIENVGIKNHKTFNLILFYIFI